jgi:hypothetical protein
MDLSSVKSSRSPTKGIGRNNWGKLSRIIWRVILVISIILPFLNLSHPIALASSATNLSTGSQSLTGGDGLTFEQRRLAWLASMPDPDGFNTVPSGTDKEAELDHRVEDYLFGWLENCATKPSWKDKCVGDVVTQMITWFVSTSYWIDKGPKQQRGYAMMIPLKYYGGSPFSGSGKADVISDTAYNAVLKRFRDRMIGEGGVFEVGQPNKELASVVGVYLYTSHFDQSIKFDQFGCIDSSNDPCLGTHFKTFSYPKSLGGTGQTYEFGGGPYNAHDLIRDWLMYRLDGWFFRKNSPYGNRELDSINYARHFAHMLMLLTEFSPESDIRARATMATDVALLDSLMDFSANSWGGTIGRTDYKHMDRSPIYPHRVLWGISGDEGGADKWDISAVYAVNHAPSDLLVELSRFEEDWRFHMEYNARLNNAEGKGKWNYLTWDYNMGSSVGQRNQGWSANVRGPGETSFIRFFINADGTAPADNRETSYQGDKGYQFRNAMFVNLGSKPYYWEFQSGVSWDEETSENGWKFKRLGNAFVAIQLGGTTAAVELAQKGVDYSSYAAFKSAVKATASLSSSSFTTSKGVTIDKNDPCGFQQPGDCGFPFAGLETESSHGKLIDWRDGVMTVTKSNLHCQYDFNTWKLSGNACPGDITSPEPTPPPTTTQTFEDVPPSHWAFDYIETLVANNYISGCGTNPMMYCPDSTMTRAEGAVFVLRGIQGAGYMPPDPTSQIFEDVNLQSWSAKWATGLWESAYTAGCDTNPLLYCPEQGHTRAEGAVFYLRMLNGPSYEPPTPQGLFTDAPLGEWYTRWVEDAYSTGILPECESEPSLTVCPDQPLDRAMAAYMMVQAKGIPISTP